MGTSSIIILIVAIMVLGAIDVLIALGKIRKESIFINDYYEILLLMREKVALNNDISEEVTYVYANSKKLRTILGTNAFMPIHRLNEYLKCGNLASAVWQINEIYPLIATCDTSLREVFSKIKKQLINPFTLFYRGVGRIMYIVFGFLISKIDANFNFEGKMWSIINATVAFWGGVASIWQLIAYFYK